MASSSTALPAACVLLLLLLASSVAGQHDGHNHGGHGDRDHGSKAGGDDKACANLDACVTDPTGANCTTAKLPHDCAVADAGRLCRAMHFMTACSVAAACKRAGADWAVGAKAPGRTKVSTKEDGICRPFMHVATVCRLDEGMSRMAGCKNYNTMCAEGSKVEMCSAMRGLAALPTTKAVNAQVRALCAGNATAPGCKQCSRAWADGKTWGDCDLLDVYGELCHANPDKKECGEWHAMCVADASLWACHGYSKAAAAAAPAELPLKKLDAGAAPAAAGGAAGAKSGAARVAAMPPLVVALLGGAAAALLLAV